MARRGFISSFAVIVLFVAAGLAGIYMGTGIPVRSGPGRGLPSVDVYYYYPGASAKAVETEATAPIEGVVSRIAGVRDIKSVSANGSGIVRVDFDGDTDMEFARFSVSAQVRQLWKSLPAGLSYPQIEVISADFNPESVFMSYAVDSESGPEAAGVYADEELRRGLETIAGVSGVDIAGAPSKDLVVEYDPGVLAIAGVEPSQIVRALMEYGEPETSVMAGNAGSRVRVRLSRGNFDPDRIMVGKRGRELALSRVAHVYTRLSEPVSFFKVNGREGVYLNILAQSDSNRPAVSRRVREYLSRVNLPDGVSLTLCHDSSDHIGREMSSMGLRLLVSIILLLVLACLSSRSLRYTTILTVSLVLNFAVSLIFFRIFGVEMEIYTLAGITIAVNLVISNIIVMIEHLSAGGGTEVFTSVLASTLTTGATVCGIFFLDERLVILLHDFVAVVLISLSVSLASSLFLVPALMQVMRGRAQANGNSCAENRFVAFYERITVFILRFRIAVIVLFIAICVCPFFLKNVRFNRLANENISTEPTLTVRSVLPPGSTVAMMRGSLERVESYLDGCRGVKSYMTHISGGRQGYIDVHFDESCRNGGTPFAIRESLIALVSDIGGGGWSVEGLGIPPFSNESHTMAGRFRIRLNGYNYERLLAMSAQVCDSLTTSSRVENVSVSGRAITRTEESENITIAVDRTRMTADSIDTGNFAESLLAGYGETAAGTIDTGNGSRRVIVRAACAPAELWDVMNIPPKGSSLVSPGRYGQMVDHETPAEIVRENQEYTLWVQFGYIGSDLNAERLAEHIARSLSENLAPGFGIQYVPLSDFDNDDDLPMWILAIIILVIFVILAIQFDSYRLAMGILLVIPVSLAGAFYTFRILTLNVGQGAFASLILLAGASVNSAIYVVDEYQRRSRSLGRSQKRGPEALRVYAEAFCSRIRTIVMTSVATVAGFVPFLVGDSLSSFWYPLAAGTAGGLLLSLVATVFFLPAVALGKKMGRGRGLMRQKL